MAQAKALGGRRSELRDADFHLLSLAFRRARVLHPF